MVRKYSKTYSGVKSSRKVAAARAAVNRASSILRARGSGPMAPPSTRGFYGLWNGRGKSELKVIDDPYTTALVPGTGAVVLLNGVATGTDYNARIGRKIIMRSILFQFTPSANSSVNMPIGDSVKVSLIYDSQPNGVLPAYGDIFNELTVVSPMNLNNRDRFQVLKEFRYTLPGATYTAGALTTGVPQPKFFKIYKKLSKPVIFNGTGSTIGSIQTGAVYLCYLANQTNNGSSLDYNCRIRFEDA